MDQGTVMRLTAMRAASDAEAIPDVRRLEDEELDRRICAGWEEWCDLVDSLAAAGGMLPSRGLARRVAAFFEDAYWQAEETRREALRRTLEAEGMWRQRGLGRGRGIT